MIRGFKHRGLKRLYENGDRRRFAPTWWPESKFRGSDAYDVDLIDYH
jgi:plasmid maintenance system killer protein